MCDRWDDSGIGQSCPVRRLFPTKLKPVSSPFVTGLNAYCTEGVDPNCNDPSRYRISRGTWFIPIQSIKHELPIPTYPLFRAPDLLYTPERSYLNMVANDPSNPYHYLAQKEGNFTVG
jgi:hypothetical protein